MDTFDKVIFEILRIGLFALGAGISSLGGMIMWYVMKEMK
jgi:hypothetical protein